MKSRVLLSTIAVLALLAPTSTAVAAEPRVGEPFWNCVAAVDDPHQSHTDRSRVNVHADLKSCSQAMPSFTIDVNLYRDGELVASGSQSGANKFKARAVANWAPPPNEWHTYTASADFTITAGQETFETTVNSRARQVCIGANCPPPDFLVHG
ncbi:hypothetical protein AB0425_00065 [Actinosynnema sp. NPDC051121]